MLVVENHPPKSAYARCGRPDARTVPNGVRNEWNGTCSSGDLERDGIPVGGKEACVRLGMPSGGLFLRTGVF